ncbi:hypothetical protein GCM10027515_14110 [Schumannella luteola]|uniref:Uncharacterized protein n=1 Tax=Schumannella luteola TaxID=472059 RepID=A0A852YDV9_9MICO|nr:hypothetical protein [Schumannella luteola]NYG97857.1 hypothetical protein [Schumannella luteola]TPW90565.1 hypothetical protein FJ656_36880 [Schumannella luteola]
MIWIVGFSIAVAIAGVMFLIRSATPAGRARRADTLARQIGLAIPSQLSTFIEARLARFSRAGAIGLLLAAVASAPVGYAVSVASGGDPWGGRGFGTGDNAALGVWPGVGVGLVAVGIVVAGAAITVRDDLGDEVRFARSTAVGLDDYIPRAQLALLRIGTIGGGVLAALLAALTVAQPATLPAALPLIGTGVIGVVALIVFEIFGRRIVGARQPSASPAELAWNDALRSAQLTQLATAPGMLGYYSLLGCTFVLPRVIELGGWPGWIGGVTALVVIALLAALGVIVLIFVWGKGNPQTHFLRRLWPEVVAQNAALATATSLASSRADEGLAPVGAGAAATVSGGSGHAAGTTTGVAVEGAAAALGSGAPDHGERSEGGR